MIRRLLVAIMLLAVACSHAPRVTPASTATARSSTSAGSTVWLCRPGMADNPCTSDLTASSVSPSRQLTRITASPAKHAKFDCFYVYPTVSNQSGMNADLQVEQSEREVAVAQASRFSTVCDVWAPIYRQRTLRSLLNLATRPETGRIAFQSLLGGWRDYLDHHNNGRPFVLVGHSQGAAVLIQLIAAQIDNDPKLRARLVSAILLGGNVIVPTGRDIGGSFTHVPACRSKTQTGCVIAYSSFLEAPPPNSLFGIPGQGVSLLAGSRSAGQQVLCTNPASLGGGRATLVPFFPTPAALASVVRTPWVTTPGLYAATCRTSGKATWLQVDVTRAAGDQRTAVGEDLGPLWGLHRVDVNIALGDLVDLVRAQESAYRPQ